MICAKKGDSVGAKTGQGAARNLNVSALFTITHPAAHTKRHSGAT